MLSRFYKRYEHHINTAAFLAGFIFDSLAFRHVDHVYIRIALAAWLLLAAAGIVIHSALHSEEPRGSLFGNLLDGASRMVPFFIQFAFGAVLSGSLIFFSHSASFSVSWPFLSVLVLFIVGNEAFRGKYTSIAFQLVSFFVAAFLYASLVTPVVLRSVGTASFIVAGALSFAAFLVVLRLVRRFAGERYSQSRYAAWAGVVGLYAIFNVLYFADLMPPLPLSLREIGIYHSLEKTPSGGYALAYEPSGRFSFNSISDVYRVRAGDPAYAFSAVFAPAGIELPIVHEWARFDEASGRWVVKYSTAFPIVGGREGGYRGYSQKDGITPGKWRVSVETKSGRLIGRTDFIVEYVEGDVPMKTIIR